MELSRTTFLLLHFMAVMGLAGLYHKAERRKSAPHFYTHTVKIRNCLIQIQRGINTGSVDIQGEYLGIRNVSGGIGGWKWQERKGS